jgi:hypothetical protein
MPSVTKDDGFTVYRVRGGHSDWEWATIAVRGWTTQPDPMCAGERRECGEILIYSSFGSWAHQWGHLETPFLRWLLTCEFGYVFTKFMGADLQEFDGEGSVKGMRKRVIDRRRTGGWSKETARAMWDAIEDVESQAECSERDFVEAFQQVRSDFEEYGHRRIGLPRGVDFDDIDRFLQEPWEHTRTRDKLAPRGFWRDLWPVFINHLKAELEQQAAAV